MKYEVELVRSETWPQVIAVPPEKAWTMELEKGEYIVIRTVNKNRVYLE